MPPPPAVPQGYGAALPKSPHELMKMIHKQNKKAKKASADKKGSESAESDPNANKSEQQSERLETKLMELEDYTYKPEGVHRLLRVFEIMSMEQEDELSVQLALQYKQELAKIALREQLRREVEERKEQELREKEERRRQAEIRRQQVVERKRRLAEEEAKRLLDAENAIKQAEIDRLNAIRLEQENMLKDQLLMTQEEEYSKLAEIEFKEQQQKKIWQQKEREKMLEWERQQKIKDELEDQKRLERMAALEERKQKLLKLQQQGGADNKPNAKEEADKLNKQLRIQNKAKFVTKKIQKGATAATAEEEAVVSVQVDNLDSVIATPAATGAASSAKAGITEEAVAAAPALTAEQVKYTKEIENITSEVVLKELQKELMDEKRTLRLEQRTRLSAEHQASTTTAAASAATVGGASVPAGSSKALTSDELKLSIDAITFKESVVEKCLERITAESKEEVAKAAVTAAVVVADPSASQHSLHSAVGASASSSSMKSKLVRTNSIKNSSSGGLTPPPPAATTVSTSSAATSTATPASSSATSTDGIHKITRSGTKPLLVDLGTSSKNLLAAPSGSSAAIKQSASSGNEASKPDVKASAAAPGTGVHTAPVSGANALFKQAEALLRESNQLIEWSAGHIKGLQNGTVLPSTAAASGEQVQQQQQHANLRRLTMLVMEIPQLGRNIAKEFDPLGYGDQLTRMAGRVKDTLAAVNAATTQALASPVKVAPSPQPPAAAASTAVPAVTAASKAPVAMHKSASTGTVPTATAAATAAAKEPTMLVSASVSNLPTESAPSPVPPSAESPKASASPITTAPMESLDETDSEDQLSDDELEAEQAILNIPGWDECINTSMATAAHHAAFYGYVKVLEVLCQYFDCFVMDKKGRTPLFYACLQNQLDCVALLVALNPAWIDVGDQAGDAPLHAAAIANGIEVLRFLLSCEAHPDTANYSGLTPSHLARTKDALVVLYESKALLYCVDNKNRMPIWYAASDGRADCCRYLCSVMPYQFMLYKDDEGDSPLHKACANGHAECVEVICSFLQGVEDLYVVNKKAHTAAHVASNSACLKALYENGANLFTCDPKMRNPLFFASFFGRLDCIIFLIEIAFSIHEKEKKAALMNDGIAGAAVGSGRNARRQLSPRAKDQSHAADVPEVLKAADIQGDTALHAACLCGHIQCVNLLCYYLLNLPNKQGISPEQLAVKAGHTAIAALVGYYDMQRTRIWAETVADIEDTSGSHHNINSVFSMQAVYGCDFNTLVSTLQYHGSRWHQGYDPNFNAVYYIDNAVPGYSQWERPETYDENASQEQHYRKAVEVLHAFYSKYNPEKIVDMNHILSAFRNNYTELFISLANKYNVEDLSMFSGVDFDS